MGRAASPQRVNDFLGSAQVFSSAVIAVVEAKLLREVSRDALTHSQFKLLKLIANTDAHSIGDVAAFLGVSNAAASKAVDKMVRRGLIVRAEGATDRRAAELSLTLRSQHMLAAYDAARNRKLRSIFRVVTGKELERTTEILDLLSTDLLDHRAQPQETCFECGIYFREKCLLRERLGRRCLYMTPKVHSAHGVAAPARAARAAAERVNSNDH